MRNLFTAAVLFMFVNNFTSTAQSCTSQDSTALVELYNSTSGLNWDLSHPISSWQGITLNANGCVKKIQLDGILTGGTIPPLLGNIQQLVELDLEDCHLTGTIPFSLGNLDHLIELDLEGNNLTGSIPSSLADLANLNELVLIDNNLAGCYSSNLLPLCDISSANNQISNGNNFDGPWHDFCTYQANICEPCRERDSLILISLFETAYGCNIDFNQPMDSWYGITLNATGCVSEIYFYDACLGEVELIPELGNLSELEVLVLSDDLDILTPIPPEIGNLSKLRILDLSERVPGTLPPELGNLFNLEILKITQGSVTGPIPSEFGNLFNLVELDLHSNNLTGELPAELQNLQNLERLNINSNNFSGNFPEIVLNFPNLNYLYISYNSFYGCYPIEAQNLCTTLTSESISAENNFDALWDNFCSQDMGVCLDCTVSDSLSLIALYNSTTGLNWDISQPMSSWQGITLNQEGCVIRIQLDALITSGTIPSELGDMHSLVELDLEDCQLTGPIPSSLGNLTHLIELDLEGNNLTGSIPISFANLTSLNELVLIDNNLDGCYPPELSSLCAISSANNQISDGNNFDGPWFDFCNAQDNDCLPCRHLDSLNLLVVYSNFNINFDPADPIDTWVGVTLNENGCISRINLGDFFSGGFISPEIGNLASLEYLNLEDNYLNGTIPAEIGNLANLEALELDDNIFLTGTIPPEIGNLTNLKFLELERNDLFGSLPQELGQLRKLNILSLDQNKLYGPLPPELGQLSELHTLSMSHNFFSGSIPNSFANLSNLNTLNVIRNSLEGCFDESLNALCSIPNTWITRDNNFDATWEDFCNYGTGACLPCREQDSLTLVSIYDSLVGFDWDLSEPIDTWRGITLNTDGCVSIFKYDDRGLTGNLPPEIGDLNNLTVLILDENNITGPIPPEIGNLSNLATLDLEQNPMSGFIPATIGNLINLEHLSLELPQSPGGPIPPEIGNLVNLISLDIAQSNLVGTIPAEIGDLPHLTRLEVWFNDLSGCFDDNLQKLCDQLIVARIDQGNNFDSTWEDFCSQGMGTCTSCTVSDSLNLLTVFANLQYQNYDITQALESWDGITLNENGCISSIILGNFSGGGFISPEIGNFGSLEILHLTENSITGTIPPEIGNLSNLEVLILDENNLTGPIPPSISNLINLVILRLDGNELSGSIPSSLANLSNLNLIDLSRNLLEGCYDEALTSLCDVASSISYSNNLDASWYNFCSSGAGTCLSCRESDSLNLVIIYGNFTDVIYDVNMPIDTWEGVTLNADGCVSKIQLGDDLGGNFISPEIGNLSQLEVLSLEENYLTGSIPAELANLTNLVTLNVRQNQLSGCFDPALAALCGDVNVYTSNNNFDETWEDFCSFGAGACTPCRTQDSLTLVSIYNNMSGLFWDFSQPIDTWGGITLNQDGCVSKFIYDDSNVSGEIPPEIGDLTHLTVLILDENYITGTIPPEIGNLTNLVSLNLEQNDISGPIPPEIWTLTNLENLAIEAPSTPGEQIPAEIGNLVNLVSLELDRSNLVGMIPPELGNLTNLTYVELWANDLSGCFDENLQSLCSQLTGAFITSGNNFDASWEDFCSSGAGICESCIDALQINGAFTSDQDRNANNTIISDAQIISGSTRFAAGQSIELLANFEVNMEAVFLAEISACQ